MARALVLVGFMGAGKSSALPGAVDTDALLERELGASIAAFFDAHGEAAFREREEAVVLTALDRAGDGDVVALGGGSLGSARVRDALRAHTVAWLDVGADTAWERAAGAGRPLARDRGAFAALHAARRPVYEAAADAFLPEADPGLVARALPALRSRPAGAKLVWARSAGGEYPVWIGDGLLCAPPWPGGDGVRRFCVTDANVAALHAVPGCDGMLAVAPGEEHKTLQAAGAVWTALVRGELTRDDHVVALGGGVVGDLAGFCAATYQRGIGVVQVPTTLVAQVDSAYGGKTGVDLPEAKNYVGAYHQPCAVIADVGALATLPAAERAAGFAEVVKTALIAGGALWERVRAGDAQPDAELVLACARTKLTIVAADERDDGDRRLLNLGHTVGHAIETVAGYGRYRHGEAVGLGLLAALRLSGAGALREEVREVLERAGLPTRLQGADPDAVAAATRRDKKRRGDAVGFVLVSAPGDVRAGEAVADADLRAAVAELAAA